MNENLFGRRSICSQQSLENILASQSLKRNRIEQEAI